MSSPTVRPDGSVVVPYPVARRLALAAVAGLDAVDGGAGGGAPADLRRVIVVLADARPRAHPVPAVPNPEVPAVLPVIVVTAAEMAARMGSTTRHVTRLCATGRLPARKAGGTWLITVPTNEVNREAAA